MKTCVRKIIAVLFVCFCLIDISKIVYAGASIKVEIQGIITSVNVETPNGGTVPTDLSMVIEPGQSVHATYTFNLPAVDFSGDPNVGYYREAVSHFSVSINNGVFMWNSTGAIIQVDSINRLDRLIVITGAPIAPVTGTLVFGNVPSYQLIYGEPYVGEFLNETTDIPYSGFLGLGGKVVVQYNVINAENEFVDTDIFFITTSVSDSSYSAEAGILKHIPAIIAASRNHKQGPEYDNDLDGYSENQGDCNDNNKSIYPGAIEICGDSIDQNCDGVDTPCQQLWFGDWIQVNFLGTDENGVVGEWGSDIPGGIGFVANVSESEWVERDEYGNGCTQVYAYTVTGNRYSMNGKSTTCYFPGNFALYTVYGRLEFLDNNTMIQWYDYPPGAPDEIIAFKWKRK